MSNEPDNLRVSDELDLIAAVLRGYRDSPAKADAMRAVGVIRAAQAKQPAPVVLTLEKIDQISNGVNGVYINGWPLSQRESRRLLAERILAAAIPPGSMVVPVGEVEALRKDAERYRWLRQLDAGGIQVYDAKTKSDLSFIGEELDAAVDAAMASRPGGQG